MSNPSDGDRLSIARGMMWATQISTLGLEIALPALGGYWLDQSWGTKPWLLIAGAMLGILVFSFSVIRLSREWGRKPPDSRS